MVLEDIAELFADNEELLYTGAGSAYAAVTYFAGKSVARAKYTTSNEAEERIEEGFYNNLREWTGLYSLGAKHACEDLVDESGRVEVESLLEPDPPRSD